MPGHRSAADRWSVSCGAGRNPRQRPGGHGSTTSGSGVRTTCNSDRSGDVHPNGSHAAQASQYRRLSAGSSGMPL